MNKIELNWIPKVIVQITKQNSYATHKPTSSANQQYTGLQDLRNMMNNPFEQVETILKILATLLTKIKNLQNPYNSPCGMPTA
jgi:hypothetical protein